jgi:hypothetical protein
MDFTSTCFYLTCLVGWCATCVEGAKLGEPGFCNPATDKIEVEWPCLVGWCATCVEGAKLGEPGFCNPATDKIKVEWSYFVSWCTTHPTEPSHTLVSHAAPFEPSRTLVSHAAPWEPRRTLGPCRTLHC